MIKDQKGIELHIGDIVSMYVKHGYCSMDQIIEIMSRDLNFPIILRNRNTAGSSKEVRKVADSNSIEAVIFLMEHYNGKF